MKQILTNREKEIINKKITNHSLTQNESNILSKSIRPKLQEIKKINAKTILTKLEYNQKAKSIENKIKNIILKIIPKVKAIIICGSAIQTNYKEYNDIDIIIVTTEQIKNKKELTKEIEKEGDTINLNLDIQLYSEKSILIQYPHNPSLIYQLKDSKIIYGKIKIPNKINLSSLDLRMKLDWSEGLDNHSKSEDIYFATRNLMLILLLMNKKVDNYELRENVKNLLGNELIKKLRDNNASKQEKKLALSYLDLITNHLEKELKDKKWGKIEIENP